MVNKNSIKQTIHGAILIIIGLLALIAIAIVGKDGSYIKHLKKQTITLKKQVKLCQENK
jgi:hypothetical protein